MRSCAAARPQTATYPARPTQKYGITVALTHESCHCPPGVTPPPSNINARPWGVAVSPEYPAVHGGQITLEVGQDSPPSSDLWIVRFIRMCWLDGWAKYSTPSCCRAHNNGTQRCRLHSRCQMIIEYQRHACEGHACQGCLVE